jgi:hypothetical protein
MSYVLCLTVCTGGVEEYNPNTRARLRENLLQNYSKDIHPVKSHKDKIQVTASKKTDLSRMRWPTVTKKFKNLESKF